MMELRTVFPYLLLGMRLETIVDLKGLAEKKRSILRSYGVNTDTSVTPSFSGISRSVAKARSVQ